MDPTPFLERGQLLLTDGSQFAVGVQHSPDFDPYVRRLVEAGVVALGFGAQLMHGKTLVGLAEACRRNGLVLFEILDMTPYLAFIRFVADAVAQERTERIQWSLNAQRALTKAAIRDHGLSSIITELERQLDCYAFLFDASGAPVQATHGDAEHPAASAMVRAEVSRLLVQGVRSATQVEDDGIHSRLQTIGRGRTLDGVLVISGVDLPDQLAVDLVHSVIAFATLALTQNRALSEADRHLRRGVLEQLISGDPDVARRTANVVWGGLPAGSMTVLRIKQPSQSDVLLEALERQTDDGPDQVFFAQDATSVVVLTRHAGLPTMRKFLREHGVVAGSSRAEGYGQLRRALREAEIALRRAVETGGSSVDFSDVMSTGVIGMLDQRALVTTARSRLAPLRQHDQERGTSWEATLITWLRLDCSWDLSAAELGIHRHTLRRRVQRAGEVLNLDLSTMAGRFELWAALRVVEAD